MNFFRRYKKVFLIIAFLLFSAFLAYLIWLPFLRVDEPELTDEEILELIGQLPPEAGWREIEQIIDDPDRLEGIPGIDRIIDPFRPDPSIREETASPIAAGGLTQTERVVRAPTINPIMDSQGNISYFDLSDNKFYRLDRDGNIIELSDRIFQNAIDITWSPDADKAIVKYFDGNKAIYNFKTDRQIVLPKHWDDFSFSPDGSQIAGKSIGSDPNNRWLMTFNDDGTSARAIESIGRNADNVNVSWSPNQQMIATWTRGLDFNRQELLFVGLHGENFKSTIVEGRGLQYIWSETGENLLYSAYSSANDMKPMLWIVDSTSDTMGQSRRRLGIETWAEKCTFVGTDDVYCAVPEYLPRGAGLVPEIANETPDNLYHINIKTGARNMIAIPENNVNISQIMVTNEQDVLYFSDNRTGQIYSVNLK